MEKEVKLFDKSFVYFMWDDELEGKECFVSDSIDSLETGVKQTWSRMCSKVTKGNCNYPFAVVWKENNLSDEYRFAYYDPNYEVKKAFKEGKQIQVAYKGANNWVDCDEPEWVDGCQFRVKPECPCEEGIDSKACAGCPQDEARKQTFRPFKYCDELVEFWSKNYQTGFRPAFTKPLIWVRLKVDKRERLIVAFGTDFVEIGNKAKAVPLQKLFDDYEFLDGNPCGMEVKE